MAEKQGIEFTAELPKRMHMKGGPHDVMITKAGNPRKPSKTRERDMKRYEDTMSQIMRKQAKEKQMAELAYTSTMAALGTATPSTTIYDPDLNRDLRVSAIGPTQTQTGLLNVRTTDTALGSRISEYPLQNKYPTGEAINDVIGPMPVFRDPYPWDRTEYYGRNEEGRQRILQEEMVYRPTTLSNQPGLYPFEPRPEMRSLPPDAWREKRKQGYLILKHFYG